MKLRIADCPLSNVDSGFDWQPGGGNRLRRTGPKLVFVSQNAGSLFVPQWAGKPEGIACPSVYPPSFLGVQTVCRWNILFEMENTPSRLMGAKSNCVDRFTAAQMLDSFETCCVAKKVLLE